jgi:hypothetical protein
VEVKIGIQNVAREVVFESDKAPDEIADVVTKALTDGVDLRLKDSKGKLILVPAGVIGYVEIGVEEVRRVGFGAL